jgi:ATP-dependent DNA helicase RecG
MTNKSLRERFRLPADKSASVSQVIAAATESGLIRADEDVGQSKRFARYLPGWA